jgi:FkbM family methyltransferase
MMLDLVKMYEKYQIPKKGVIHVGAHEGGEIKFYQKLGIPKVVFVEANPEVYERLKEAVGHLDGVQTVCCAIGDKIGKASLHVTSMDQSSSILPLKYHRVVYPDITEVACIEVECNTLDNLLVDLKLHPCNFNFVNIDIQGAELLAFRGAEYLLRKYIQAINTEVNYKEMYESCALKSDIDNFLGQFGFVCRETVTPHPTWGDALYVKG